MELFIENLPQGATQHDLIRFFKQVGMIRWFTGIWRSVEIEMRTLEKLDGTQQRVAIASFKSKHLAHRVIKRLNGKALKGHHLIVREYVHRNYSNERRAIGWRNRVWDGHERRRHERRVYEVRKPSDNFEALLKESEGQEQREPKIEAYKDLARKL